MLDLKDRVWREFQIGSLFDVKIGKAIYGNKVDLSKGKTAYITRKESNNGLDGFIDYDTNYLNIIYPVITIGNETAEPFVQSFPFFTGTKVNILSAKIPVSLQTLLFVTQSMRMHKSKYSYTFTINSTRLKKQIILLPITASDEPDWQFMEDYIRERERELLHEYIIYAKNFACECAETKEITPLQEKEWQPFYFGDIFTQMQRGKRLKKDDHRVGKRPYISSTASNNGVDGFVSNKGGVRAFNNCLTVANSGSVGTTFYHTYEFVASDHVTQLKNSDFTRYVYLFLAPIISRLSEKYSFNREINDKRIKKELLLLPVDDNANPDWEYMEQCAKSIVQQQLSAYLRYYLDKTKRCVV